MTLLPFAEDWFDARSRFLEAAGRAGLEVESHRHPDATAPNGAPLFIDIAHRGRAGASHGLLSLCGTHGVEGYAGSAAQIELLDGGRLGELPAHVGVVLVHGLNPWGWSRDSQLNEDRIDLNRNFVDFERLPPPVDGELIDRVARLLDSVQTMSSLALAQGTRQLFALRDEVGGDRFMRAIGAGQYVQPGGMKYGGTAPAWSNRVLRQSLRRHLASATHVAALDWHTGLGDYGDVFPLFFGVKGSEAYEQTCRWWGRAAVDRGLASWSVDDAKTPAPTPIGVALSCLSDEVPDVQIAGGCIEFGTLPLQEIEQINFLDHWRIFRAAPTADDRCWRALMRTLMAPREPAWERSVLAHARSINERTLQGLIAWMPPRS